MRMVLVLFFVCLFSALLLGFVYLFTSPRIEKLKEEFFTSSISELFPNLFRYEELKKDILWAIYDSLNQKLGIVFRAEEKGYAGPVSVIVGVDTLGMVVNLRIASPAEGLKETPGLGLKVREDFFRKQFIGKKAEEIRLKKEGGEIEAVTAATISSRAVASAVREGILRYQEFLKHNEK